MGGKTLSMLTSGTFEFDYAKRTTSHYSTTMTTTTRILVFSPGGYRFTDYVKVGLPVMHIFLAVSLVHAVKTT